MLQHVNEYHQLLQYDLWNMTNIDPVSCLSLSEVDLNCKYVGLITSTSIIIITTIIITTITIIAIIILLLLLLLIINV